MASDPRPSRFRSLAALLAWVLALWTVLTTVAIAIAFGRAHMPFLDAFRSRYFTPPGIFWACLLAVA
jgi:uncharacterized membrane protein